MATQVTVTKLPLCDICKMADKEEVASYDAKTIFGSWANVCEEHFLTYTEGRLGTGFGQRLVLRGA